jgi:hypothetical protein
MLWTILIVILILALLGGYYGGWRGHPGYGAYYGPGMSILGLVVIILIVLLLVGRI